jgi:hypothetical protein
MKILFSTSHFGFLRNFQSTLRLLAERGHRLHFVADRVESLGASEMLEVLAADCPGLTYEILPIRKKWTWYSLTIGLRLCLDYWRYFEPRFENSPRLRSRAAGQVPPIARWLPELPLLRTAAGRRVLRTVARRMERVMPIRPEVEALLDRERPDLVLLTPLLYFGSMQVDHVRAARRRGVPTMLCVGSWDHLTTKGLIHEVPDRVAVWNEPQRAEAAELHGVPAERVEVTGAPAYDHWFVSRPSVTREIFCSRVGLPHDRPILLYLCSSPFITPREVEFVQQWIRGVRSAADPAVRSAAILVRPHPQNADQWRDADLSGFGDVAIWPREGANPIHHDARAEYHDSMYFSEVVVGVNTSALIESGIIGRPVVGVVAPEFAGTQEGTLHFQHLKNVNGGLLTTAASPEDHYRQIGTILADPEGSRQRARRFIASFVRPHGVDRPATPLLVDAMERLGLGPRPVARPEPLTSRVSQFVLYPAAVVAMIANLEEERLYRMVLRPFQLAAKAVRRTSRWLVRRLVLWPARRVARMFEALRRFVRIAVRRVVWRPSKWLVSRARMAIRMGISGFRRREPARDASARDANLRRALIDGRREPPQ